MGQSPGRLDIERRCYESCGMAKLRTLLHSFLERCWR